MDNNELDFKAAVNDALMFFMSDLFHSLTNFTNKCSDGIIKYDPHNSSSIKIDYFDIENTNIFRNNVKKVAIILESPHTDEYSNKDGRINNPICAKGQTGKNLKKQLQNLLKNMGLKNQEVDIVIINAIPYQCSQGVSTEILRDFVWLKCWYEFGYDNMIALLKNIEPNYIVNCCTKGCHFLFSSGKNISKTYIEKVVGTEVFNEKKKRQKIFDNSPGKKEYSLREFVSQCLRNYAQSNVGVKLHSCSHPCTWYDFDQANFGKMT